MNLPVVGGEADADPSAADALFVFLDTLVLRVFVAGMAGAAFGAALDELEDDCAEAGGV